VARAPDIVEMCFEYRGDPARVFAGLLGVTASHVFELSQAAEHRALPRRDAALRDRQGFLPSDLGARVSTEIRVVATWIPRTDTLRLEGYFADLSTALPARRGRRYAFFSPTFVKPPPGWHALFLRLMATGLPLDVTFAQATLHRQSGLCVEIAFDPPR